MPYRVWEDLSIDFFTHLPVSAGKIVIWFVVDRMTKYAHFISLLTKFTATSLTVVFSQIVYWLHEEPKYWSKFLRLKEYWYDTTHHTSNGMSLFRAMYGRNPQPIVHYLSDGIDIAAIENLVLVHCDILNVVKYHLARAHQRMKWKANTHRHEYTFAVGDWVLLRLQPY
ncbi:UNVERIFIED_CONTAM: hypothetical protein Scaly_1793400 [Sesamum calycinum]|uniref:Uncharacterized protein n=1 Tax=Sesamum calycinum TaxID=2727403 RepID=A0AAW2NW02_9LAMI